MEPKVGVPAARCKSENSQQGLFPETPGPVSASMGIGSRYRKSGTSRQIKGLPPKQLFPLLLSLHTKSSGKSISSQDKAMRTAAQAELGDLPWGRLSSLCSHGLGLEREQGHKAELWMREVEQGQEKKGSSIKVWCTLKDHTIETQPFSFGQYQGKAPHLFSPPKGQRVCQSTTYLQRPTVRGTSHLEVWRQSITTVEEILVSHNYQPMQSFIY